MVKQKILIAIRAKIQRDRYALSSHAEKEMQDDSLTELEVEEAILNDVIVRIQKDKFERTVYTIEGITKKFRKVRIVCRFSDSGQFLIVITVYEII